jgi:hypothetical protein
VLHFKVDFKPHSGLTRLKHQRLAKLGWLVHSTSLPECQVEVLALKNLLSSESNQRRAARQWTGGLRKPGQM